MAKLVKVTYDATLHQTTITVDGTPFDTSRIDGREIEDWAYPFTMRKVKWNGFYEEMVEALGGEKEFSLVFDGPQEALAELQEAWEDAPVTVEADPADSAAVVMEYDEKNCATTITVNGEPFDTSRIDGREIEDWVYPFQIRKIKWSGIFDELEQVVGSASYAIRFTGSDAAMQVLQEECPETVSIFKQACEKEDGTELENLALQYDKGDGVPQDYAKAFELRQRAAELGNVISISNLGWHYQYGNGVEQDYAKAFEWYRKAAEAGNAWAQQKVGYLYNNGYGVEMDEQKR